MSKYFFFTLILAFVSYFCFLLFIFLFQRSFMYYPNINSYLSHSIKFNYEEVFVSSSEKIQLKSWFSYDPNNKKTILFFHGNAGDLDNRIYKLNEFYNLKVNFLIISWRGFSGNDGKPSEKGLYQDALSAVAWLKNKGIGKKNIILYGESLGTGVATELASRDDYAGVILESPFTSMVDMGKKFYPYLPVSLLQRDRYNSLKKIKKIHSPILVMHGKADSLVPFRMGKKIFDEANEPKFSYFPETDNHMMSYTPQLISVLNQFIN
jgi:fermentation-respiration switch protein FrsA (DUF1100 family)